MTQTPPATDSSRSTRGKNAQNNGLSSREPSSGGGRSTGAGAGDEAVGVVVIGRNEGQRLVRCLESLIAQGAGPIVYVDSGSTDGSVEHARRVGVEVVNLDTSVPFTMARGRNAGFEELQRRHPTLRWVQFVDGDCEVQPGWIASARRALVGRDDVAAVCGRRRERYPEASIYNRLADMEWDGPVGEIEECGGDVLFRSAVFLELGGFNPGMIAGEEPELCVRLRSAGHKVVRLAEEMTLHDAAMTRFSQWWKRAVRGGHSYAEGMAMHGRGPTRHNVKRTLSALTYGLVLPGFFGSALAFAALGIGLGPAVLVPLYLAPTLLVPLAYGRAWLGAYLDRRRRGDERPESALYASFCMLGKLPEAIGIATYWANRARGRYATIMEYKAPEAPAAQSVERASAAC